MQKVDLNEILIFVRVVQNGSFTKAALQMGMPNSTVSARITSLEKRLGVLLLQRTTRQLNLTQAGREYFDYCLGGIEEITKAENFVLSRQLEPVGDLRITAPVFLGSELLPEVIAECQKKYPKINIEVILKDQAMDLISERIDVALRAGELHDSSLILRKLGVMSFSAYASPKFLKDAPPIKHPKELTSYNCIQFMSLGRDSWRFTNGKNSVVVPMSGRTLIDEVYLVKSLVSRGSGIGLLPDFICGTEKGKGRLTRVLPEWRSEVRQIQLVHPPQKFPSLKLQAFMQVAIESITKQISLPSV